MPSTKIKATPNLRLLRAEEIPHVLKEGELGAVLEWAVTDPTGKVTQHVVKKSASFVQQFLQLLYIQMVMLPLTFSVSVRDTGNALRNINSSWGINASGYLFDVLAGATVTTFGIVVGTGVGIPTISDFQLLPLIAHGAGAGAMQYGGVTFGAPGSDATTSQLTITRNFTANVGGITPTEIGLYCRAYDGAARYFMIIRDVIAGGILVPAGNVLTTNYRLQATI